MTRQKVRVENETGLHARPAAKFVQKASSYDADIRIEIKGQRGNAKSIMQVMSLGIGKGDEIFIEAEGKDEKIAIEELVDFIKKVLPSTENE